MSACIKVADSGRKHVYYSSPWYFLRGWCKWLKCPSRCFPLFAISSGYSTSFQGGSNGGVKVKPMTDSRWKQVEDNIMKKSRAKQWRSLQGKCFPVVRPCSGRTRSWYSRRKMFIVDSKFLLCTVPNQSHAWLTLSQESLLPTPYSLVAACV